MSRKEAREWTFGLYNSVQPGMPDAYEVFRRRLAANLPGRGGTLLDLGCGDENFLTGLVGRAEEVIGVDIVPCEGPYHRYLAADVGKEIPLGDDTVDLAISRYLIEHLRFPNDFFKELRRVLRPGGAVILLTPNALYYPFAANKLLSMVVTQERRMRLVYRITGREPEDVFPVIYGCNTPGKVRRELEAAGLEVVDVSTYCAVLVSAFNRPLGLVAVFYEYLVNLLGLEGVKGLIVAEAVKR